MLKPNKSRGTHEGTKSSLRLWKHLGSNPHFLIDQPDIRVLWKSSSQYGPLLHEGPEFLVISPSRCQHLQFPGCLDYWIPK